MGRWVVVFFVLAASVGFSGDGDRTKSGPQPGTILPAPFDAIVLNGKVGGKVEKDRPHCLICGNGLNPAVLIFAREGGKSEKTLLELVERLDALVGKLERTGLAGFVVFLSPDARTSVEGSSETDSEKLLDEATKRNALLERLRKLAEPLTNVLIAAYGSDGPKGYDLNPKAEVTVVLYQRLRVLANWAFEDGALTSADNDAILKQIETVLVQSANRP
ncbi:MAG: hypothetical protein NZO58_02925 [Gemmataceae bacterium]|nr:hypothetical protein [Gemmataceae bacterium]